eukprot:COSAG02_NODE_66_length_42609_cov_95.996848_24_plen_94_part_00
MSEAAAAKGTARRTVSDVCVAGELAQVGFDFKFLHTHQHIRPHRDDDALNGFWATHLPTPGVAQAVQVLELGPRGLVFRESDVVINCGSDQLA